VYSALGLNTFFSGNICTIYNFKIRAALDIWLDNPVFFISGIQPDTGFDLPDIRPDTRN
jgi:hypothetical protein